MAIPMKRWAAFCLILGGLFCVALVLFQNWSRATLAVMAPQSPVVAALPAKHVKFFDLSRQRQAVARLPVDEVHRYKVDLKKDELLDAVVDQDIKPAEKIDVAVRLIRPDGRSLDEINSINEADGPEEIYLLADQTGEYQIEVAAGSAGAYRIKIRSIRVAGTADRENAEAERLFYHARAMSRQKPPNYPLANSEYLEAANHWLSLGNCKRQANALEQAGIALYQGLDQKKSLSVRMEALRLYHDIADRRSEARLLVSVGNAQRALGKVGEAEKFYRRALDVALAIGCHEQEAEATYVLGSLFYQRGEKGMAFGFFERSLDAWRLTNKPKGLVRALESIGVIHASLGNVRYAMQYFKEAERVLEPLDNDKLRIECLTRISEAFQAMGKFGEALAYARRALALSQKIGDANSGAATLNTMALTYKKMGDFDQARDAGQQALAVFRQIKDVRNEASVHYNLGLILLDAKDLPGAIEHFDRAAALAHQQAFPEAEIAGLYGMALAEKMNGNPIAARDLVQKALNLIESVSKAALGGSGEAPLMAARAGSYELLIDLLIKTPASAAPQEDIVAAFEASERARWRVLLDSLTPSQLQEGLLKPADTALAEKREILKKEIEKTENEHNRLHLRGMKADEILKLQKDLVARLRTLDARDRLSRMSGPTPVIVREAQRLLDQDTVLLEYFLGKHRSFLWLVTPSSIDVYELADRKTIEQSAHRLHELLSESQSRSNEEQASRVGKELSRLLLGPVAERLSGKRLVIVPDGAIHYVSFAALSDPRGESTAPLIASKQIVYQPSMSVLRAIRSKVSRRKAPPGLVAVLADPSFIPEEYSRLEHSGEEARRILELVSPREKTLQALGCEANRDLVLSGKLAQFRYLHFATHGYNHPEEPELSAIVLSQIGCDGRRRDGHLRLQDIKTLDLRADLVVLSACQTALGNEVEGEGFESLTQGFMYAGAAAVVVSLWNVDDESTSALMEQFYRGILLDGLPPSEALRRAQLWMAEKTRWRSPFFWAGFEIQGEWH